MQYEPIQGESIVMARKPLGAKTIAANVLEFGTGGINIDGCRIGSTVETWPKTRSFTSGISPGYTEGITKGATQETGNVPAGRWPPNVILSDEAAKEMDRQSGEASRFYPSFTDQPESNGAKPGAQMQYEVIQGDCIGVLSELDDETFDSVVTDPPYALSFMGKDWDSFGNGKGYQAWCQEWAAECLRVLKPGGYLLAFGGTRTYHRLACAIEDAGFEIRDSLHWIYGSGFPKSRDISKAIDSEAGAEREVIGKYVHPATGKVHADFRTDNDRAAYSDFSMCNDTREITAPATAAAETWAGWGTALKPAHEPIVVARKPLAAKTVAANVLEHGTGGINIAGCRVGTEVHKIPGHKDSPNDCMAGRNYASPAHVVEGRWPPNVVLSHSPDCIDNLICALDCPVQEMDRQSGIRKNGGQNATSAFKKRLGWGYTQQKPTSYAGDSGGASRFFPCFPNPDPLASSACFKYQAKASRKERPDVDGIPGHPTVKPVALMQWLAKLVTPPGGYVLDPFAGTGTTAEACRLEGFDCLLIERDSDSIRRIEKRMSKYEGVKT